MTPEMTALQPGDEGILAQVPDDLFENPLTADAAKALLADPQTHTLIVTDKGVVVGFASAVRYSHAGQRPQLWINELAVLPSHRRNGLGMALLHRLFEFAREHQCSNAWVLAERDNPGAQALYAAAGGQGGADDTGPPEAMQAYSFAL